MTRFRILSILILLTAIGLRLHLASVLGTQYDEGLHLTAAERIASGERLYRDLFENRTPGVEWSLGALFRLTGPDQLLARYLNIGMALLTVAGLLAGGRAAHRLLGSVTGYRLPWRDLSGSLAGLLYALSAMPLFWSRYVMLEHWQAAATTLSVLCALLAWPSKPRWWFFSGLLAGAALMAKQTAIVAVAALALYLALLVVLGNRAQILRCAGAWLAGLSLVLILFLLVLASQDSLTPFLHYFSGTERLNPLSGIATKIANWLTWAVRSPLAWMAATGLASVIVQRQLSLVLLPIWAGLETAALFGSPVLDIGWGGFSHYLLPSVAALSLSAGLGYAWLWQRFWPAKGRRWLPVGFSLLLLATVPAWLADLKYAALQTTYPQPDQSAEDAIARATAAATDEGEPILALANGIFYFRSGRPPENVFFHYPEYLAESSLGPEAEADIVKTLTNPSLSAVLVSRIHLEERLSPDITAALWQYWAPAALFPYPYQRDVFLFLPNPPEVSAGAAPAAVFQPTIELLEVRPERLGPDALLVELTWRTSDRLDEDLVVFTHLLADDGSIVAQHDGVPAVGFRPMTSWKPGEKIVDRHWITLPGDLGASADRLSIGLYDPITGNRRPLLKPGGEVDSSFLMDLDGGR